MTAAQQPSGDARAWFESEGRLLPADEIRSYLEWSGVDAATIEAWIREALERAAAPVNSAGRAAPSSGLPGSEAHGPSSVEPEGTRGPLPDNQEGRPGGRSTGAEIVPLRPATAPAPDTHGHVPPQNLEAEEWVLGSILVAPKALGACAEILAPDGSDFYRHRHAMIWRACLHLDAAGEPVDALTVADRLDETGDLEEAGGKVRLHELANIVPATANVAHWARIVSEMATLRGLVDAGQRISRLGWERPGEAGELVDQAQQITLELGDQNAGGGTEHVKGALALALQKMTDRYESGKDVVGLASGFRDLDRLTAGFEDGNLIILAARPSMGKSALAHAIAANVSIRQGLPVALFTPEMSRAEISQRFMAREAHVDLYRLRTGKLNPDDWPRLTGACNRISGAPLYLNDQGALTLATVRAECRRLARNGLALVVVDYLQLMSGEGENRTQEVSKLSRGLKILARDLNVPVLALSQLSRAVEQRNDKRPILSDLRESGAVEQDADLVAFLYRDEYYNPETSEDKGLAELILAKHRNGPTDHIKLAFRAGYATFTDVHTPGIVG